MHQMRALSPGLPRKAKCLGALPSLNVASTRAWLPQAILRSLESPCIRCGPMLGPFAPRGAIVENDETATVWEALRDPKKILLRADCPLRAG